MEALYRKDYAYVGFEGLTCAIAAIHAYIADCTLPEMRSRTFSRSLGLLFIGVAFGPTVGSLLIRLTQSTMSVFYMATAAHVLYALSIWFIVPESLSPRVRAINRATWATEKEEAKRVKALAVEKARDNGQSALMVKATYRMKNALDFLRPLATVAPVTIQDGKTLGKKRLDWSLTLIAGAFGFATLVIVRIIMHVMTISMYSLSFERARWRTRSYTLRPPLTGRQKMYVRPTYIGLLIN